MFVYDMNIVFQTSLCCGYGTDGMKTTAGYDCIMIPGASKATGTMVPPAQCGGFQGLVTAKASKQTSSKTVCSKYKTNHLLP